MNRVQALLEDAVSQRIGSGSAAAWGDLSGNKNNEVYAGKTSHFLTADSVGPATIFDLASLTKVLAMTSLYMVFDEQGMLHPEDLLERHLPEEVKAHPHLKGISIGHLLSHTSGLPAHRNIFEELKMEFGPHLPFASIQSRKKSYDQKILAIPREHPIGERVVYSDIGASLLSYLAEKITGMSFDQLVQERVWSSIPACDLHYRPVVQDSLSERLRVQNIGESIAMTEFCPWRGWLQGQVHDDNCWSMGGVAAHAGVFGTLNGVRSWVHALVDGRIVSMQTLQRFTREVLLADGQGARRTLGFDMPALDGSGSTGFYFSPHSVGHLGFTGTSLWIDLDRNRYAVLLTNRVHPSRNDLRIRSLRRAFHAILSP